MPTESRPPRFLSIEQVRALVEVMEREGATAVRIYDDPTEPHDRVVPLRKVAPVGAEVFNPIARDWTEYLVRERGNWSPTYRSTLHHQRGTLQANEWHGPPL